MQQFNTLEIQKKIEEKRLILGKKNEDFLLQKFSLIRRFFSNILAAKYSTIIGCSLIVAISVLAGSMRDIGYKSAEHLVNIFDSFNQQNLIIYLEIMAKFCGILSLFLSAKILKKSTVFKDKLILNLVVFSFAIGLFIPTFILQFKEFGTLSYCFLLCAYPYISYQFLKNSELKKYDQIIVGILAASLFCLKINYGILVLIFEAEKALRNKKSLFCLRNLITVILVTLFYSFAPYKTNLPAICINDLFSLFRENIFPLILLLILSRKLNLAPPFFLSAIAGIFITISEFGTAFDQKFILYSLALPLLALSIFTLAKNHQFNFKKNRLLFIAILLIPQFDPQNSFSLALDLCAFWPVFVLLIAKSYKTKIVINKATFSKVFLPQNLDSWFYFSAIAAINWTLFFNKEFSNSAFVISAIIFILLIDFNQNLQEKIAAVKKLTRLSSCAILIISSYFISLHLAAIFNFSNSPAFHYKTPNHITEEMAKTIMKYSNKNDGIIIISNDSATAYPLLSYLNKKPISITIEQLNNAKNTLIFVERKSDFSKKKCEISELENYLRNTEFRKIFLRNYVFLNRIIEKKTFQKEVTFFQDEKEIKTLETSDLIERDVDVYIRK